MKRITDKSYKYKKKIIPKPIIVVFIVEERRAKELCFDVRIVRAVPWNRRLYARAVEMFRAKAIFFSHANGRQERRGLTASYFIFFFFVKWVTSFNRVLLSKII